MRLIYSTKNRVLGEWWATTHFGDPDDNDCSNPDWFHCMSPEAWADRKDIMNELLANIPKDLYVE